MKQVWCIFETGDGVADAPYLLSIWTEESLADAELATLRQTFPHQNFGVGVRQLNQTSIQ